MEDLKFGIKVLIKGDGSKIFIPVIKRNSKSIFSFLSTWNRIVLIDNKFYTDDVDVEEVDLTENQCYEYIEGYRKQLKEIEDKKIVFEEVREVEW